MSFESSALAVLTAATGVTALCPAPKINFGTAPQNPTAPFIALFRISTNPQHALDNGGSAAVRMDNLQLQATCYGRTYADVNALAEQIRLALEAHRAIRFLLTDQRAAYDDFPDLHGQLLTFSVWHSTTLA